MDEKYQERIISLESRLRAPQMNFLNVADKKQTQLEETKDSENKDKKNNFNQGISKKVAIDHYFPEKPPKKGVNDLKQKMIQTKINQHFSNEEREKSNSSNDVFHSTSFNQFQFKKITDFFNYKDPNITKKPHLELPIVQETDPQAISKDKQLTAKMQQLYQEIQKKDNQLLNICQENWSLKEQISKITQVQSLQQKLLLCQFMKEKEETMRTEQRNQIKLLKYRLGDIVTTNEGTRYVNRWQDSQIIKTIKDKLDQIKTQKDELEFKTKQLKLNKKKDPFLFENSEQSNSLTETPIQDQKNKYSLHIAILQKEENYYRQELAILLKEQQNLEQLIQSRQEEDNCKFAKNQKEGLQAWPLINERYQILKLIGRGGFSEVYKAFDIKIMSEVAVKVHQMNSLWSEAQKDKFIKHVQRDTDTHQKIEHPNVVQMFEMIDIDSQSQATVLEYCDGQDLSTFLKKYGCIPEKDAKTILKMILSGLKYLHEHELKIIHYDLKPANLIFHKEEIKIADFGLCKVMADEKSTKMELTNQGAGTYWYLPPECFILHEQNPPKISTKVDIWSVGIIFFEMLYNSKPFGNNMTQNQVLQEQIIVNSRQVSFPAKPAVSKEAQEFIRCCLQYYQDDRYDVKQAYYCPYIQKK